MPTALTALTWNVYVPRLSVIRTDRAVPGRLSVVRPRTLPSTTRRAVTT